MQEFTQTMQARPYEPIDLRDVEFRFPTADPYDMARSASFRHFWKSREDDVLWIAFGSVYESDSLADCLKILGTIEHSQDLPFQPRVFGHIPFDTQNEKNVFSIPRFIARYENHKYQQIEIGITENPDDIFRLPALIKTKKAEILEEINKFPRTEWREAIDTIKLDIASRKSQKVVLARQVEIEFSESLNPANILRNLKSKNPNTFIYCEARKRDYFMGASPECLFRLKNGLLSSDSLAGTQNIHDSGDLLNSDKNLKEQNFVTDYLKDAFANLCTTVNSDSVPEIKEFGNLLHLVTKITGKLRDGIGLEKVLEKLHPTPAVCGVPSDMAMNLIHELEPESRGLFTGAIGWATNDEAEFAVAIRSARVYENAATLFAGAGIVMESDADQEYDECSLKMDTMRRALIS